MTANLRLVPDACPNQALRARHDHQTPRSSPPLLVVTYVATALVVLGSFLRSWVRIPNAIGRPTRRGIGEHDKDAYLALLVAGTSPAGPRGPLPEHVLPATLPWRSGTPSPS